MGQRGLIFVNDMIDDFLLPERYIPQCIDVEVPPRALLQLTQQLINTARLSCKEFHFDACPTDRLRLLSEYRGERFHTNAVFQDPSTEKSTGDYRVVHTGGDSSVLARRINKPKYDHGTAKAIRSISRILLSGKEADVTKIVNLCQADIGLVVNYFEKIDGVLVRVVGNQVSAVRYRKVVGKWKNQK